jgi:predicted DNA-binding WGR domain protein
VSEWNVSLTFEEDNSSKFWRARVDGTTLYVNFGRIGTNGQTQVKEFPSAAQAQKEIEKLEREKRKKGYADEGAAGGAGAGDEDEEVDDRDDDDDEEEEEDAPRPAAKKPAAAAFIPSAKPAGQSRTYRLSADGRQVELTLSVEGNEVRTLVKESYPNTGSAKEAFERLHEGMVGEGYRQV